MPRLRAPMISPFSMRALGHGSVSSLLKVILDVVYVALWAAAAVIALAAIALLLASPFKIGSSTDVVTVNGHRTDLATLLRQGPRVAGLLLGVEGYLAALIIILNRLRKVFETLIGGDPFRPENVGRLRQVGGALVIIEALSYGVRQLAHWLFPASVKAPSFSVDLTAWFSILVVFVLAEVFREGARLRSDAELTI